MYAAAAKVPRGRVATYGQLAVLIGVPRGARAVGWALRALARSRAATVPWHRVVGAGGRISPRAGPGPDEQRRRLRAEGVAFRGGLVDMARHAFVVGARASRPGPSFDPSKGQRERGRGRARPRIP